MGESSTLVTDDAAETVRMMKADGKRSMRTLGSLILCRSLLQARLMDPRTG